MPTVINTRVRTTVELDDGSDYWFETKYPGAPHVVVYASHQVALEKVLKQVKINVDKVNILG